MIEIVNQNASATLTRAVIFDFDGTISLIRSGWMEVMVPMCVGELAAANPPETEAELTAVVEEFVWRLTGKETIYQMMALADAIRQRGGAPLEPLAYKKMYLDRLWLRIRDRIEDLRAGRILPERHMVPGVREVLKALFDRGFDLYLASGTDDANVREEAALLDVSRYFGDRIFGAQDDLKSFSKALLVKTILTQAQFGSCELLVFGDGYVEIEEVKKAGGTAVGVASAEPECLEVDPWKRQRLIKAGADYVIPNFVNSDVLLATLLGVPEAAEALPGLSPRFT